MLFALLLPLFLGMGAIAVDVGYWYVVKKTAQDAADAAALAAARELPRLRGGRGRRSVCTWTRNMPEADADVEFPYVPDVRAARRRRDAGLHEDRGHCQCDPPDTFFGRIFGLLAPTISQRAVAERLEQSRESRDLRVTRTIATTASSSAPSRSASTASSIPTDSSASRTGRSGQPTARSRGTTARRASSQTSTRNSVVHRPQQAPEQTVRALATGPHGSSQRISAGFSRCTYTGATIRSRPSGSSSRNPDKVIATADDPSGTYCATQSLTLTRRRAQRSDHGSRAEQSRSMATAQHVQPYSGNGCSSSPSRTPISTRERRLACRRRNPTASPLGGRHGLTG